MTARFPLPINAKVTYQSSRWEVALVYDGLPVIRTGSGATIEEAVMNAIREITREEAPDGGAAKVDDRT